MKHLILYNTTILQIGDNYSTPVDNDILVVKGIEQPVHRLDGNQYDYNAFTHIEVASVPDNITVGDRYENGEFIKVEQVEGE